MSRNAQAVRIPGTEPPLVDWDRFQQGVEQGTEVLASLNTRLVQLPVNRREREYRAGLRRALSQAEQLRTLVAETDRAARELAPAPPPPPPRRGWLWLLGAAGVAAVGWAVLRRPSRKGR